MLHTSVHFHRAFIARRYRKQEEGGPAVVSHHVVSGLTACSRRIRPGGHPTLGVGPRACSGSPQRAVKLVTSGRRVHHSTPTPYIPGVYVLGYTGICQNSL
jgi:hypothetical protein